MNHRVHSFNLSLEKGQAEESLRVVFDTILFHRCLPKVSYVRTGNLSTGSIGFVDGYCKSLDLPYMRSSCQELTEAVRHEVRGFAENLEKYPAAEASQMSIQFIETKPPTSLLNYMFSSKDEFIWEEWVFNLKFVPLDPDREAAMVRTRNQLTDFVIDIVGLVPTELYIPSLPKEEKDLPYVFNINFKDIMPYNFKFTSVADAAQSNMSTSKLINKFIMSTLK